MHRRRLPIAMLVVLCAAGAACTKDDHAPAAATVAAATMNADRAPEVPISKTAKLAAVGMQAVVHAKPSDTSKKLGYLRLGAVVARSESSVGNEGCSGGWYAIAPAGFVCINRYASLDADAPLVRASSRRPDTTKPLPYAYGFMRGVSPLYVRVPTHDEQNKIEYKLGNHFRWLANHGDVENRATRGANDAARELIPDAAEVPPSEQQPLGVLLGGKTDADPPPFWIDHGNRGIPHVPGFDVQKKELFATRVKRHTGLAFVGSFDSGPELDNRRFAVTVDMRLIPVDKVKPETGSTFHGVEITGDLKLPLAFAKPCDPRAKGEPQPCRHPFRASDDGAFHVMSDLLPSRGLVRLTGARKVYHDTPFFETTTPGVWVRDKDVGMALTPNTWPGAAERGEKWIDVSVEQNTLVLWEGKKPVFTTLVTTGQDGLKDPKTTKSTIRGFFRLKSKHITTTMDSNERSSSSGGRAPDPSAAESPTADDKEAGAFELRDVPYVQYFHEGYALHAAYWHDHFGMARSHGCINLSPIDAMRVFRFTDPPVPEGWHGVAIEPGKGTVVIVRR